MPSTNFIAEADAETFMALKLGFGFALLAGLSFTETEPATPSDMATAAGALIDVLASALASRPECLTPAGRKELTRGVAAKLKSAIENLLADKSRAANMRIFTGHVVQ